MRHRARRDQGELIDFIEQKLGWDVVESRMEEDEGYSDDPPVLRLLIEAEFELDEDSDLGRGDDRPRRKH